jgi:hypothetical protein
MNDKIKFLTRDGKILDFTAYQTIHNLTGTQIGKYFSYKEAKFTQDIQDYGELIVCEPLMMLLDALREAKEAPVIVNSFNRDKAKQESLHARGFKAATFSPHVAKLAADVDTLNAEETEYIANLVIGISQMMGIMARVGFKQYIDEGQTFVHIDVCPEYYAPGKPFNYIPHPLAWEQQITW